MPCCPKCRSEYDTEGIIHCAKCDVDLVDELPPAPEVEKEPLIATFIGKEDAGALMRFVEKLKRAIKVFYNSENVKGNFWVFLVALFL